MAYQTFSPPVRPKTDSIETKVATLLNGFGDGYEQAVADGLNCVSDAVDLSWPVLTLSQANTIHSFFKARQAEPFRFTLAGESTARLWRCVEWSRTIETGHASMTAKLTEVFA